MTSSYMADDFESKKKQTPTFVAQASFTEIFTSVSPKVFDAANRYTLSSSKNSSSDAVAEDHGLNPVVSKVIKDAKNYCTEEELLERLTSLKEIVRDYKLEHDMESIYTLETSFIDISEDFDNEEGVAQWLAENTHDYFVQIVRGERNFIKRVKVDENGNELTYFGGLLASSPFRQDRFKEKVISREVPVSFNLTVDVPYKSIRLIAGPKHANIKKRECIIFFVFSKIEFGFFYQFITHKTKNWDETLPVFSDNWQYISAAYKEPQSFLDEFSTILKEFSLYLYSKTKEDISFEEPSAIVQEEDVSLEIPSEPEQSEDESSNTSDD